MKDFNYYLNSIEEIGYVERTTSSIVYASGLPGAKPEELVIFEDNRQGQVLSLKIDIVEILIFSNYPPKLGEKVVRTNEFIKVPVGLELLGQVIDPLGNPLTSVKPLRKKKSFLPINTLPEGLFTRKTISRQLETGVSIVDLVLPLGHGQRELIIGDRKTGKTNFLLQCIITQAKKNNICIYAAVGKKKADIKFLHEFFVSQNIIKNIVMLVSVSESPAGIIYLTPFSAMRLAEYFRDKGHNVLLVLDDLSTHAKSYREISLIGSRFPGRNSYPGDIFYTHARLLERAGNFITPQGEGSITCLPVVETMQGDLSGYIETNLMAITDGHLYFDVDLFVKGRRPAINPFLSVTRVGRQTQSNIKRQISREILSFLTLFEKMQSYIHFGAELSETTKVTISFGEAMSKFFQQLPSTTIPLNIQIILLGLIWNNIMQRKSKDYLKDADKLVIAYQTNNNIQKKVDSIVERAQSFNTFLGIISREGDKLLAQCQRL